jgi:aspartate carbamoyltransferase catalytic subunit
VALAERQTVTVKINEGEVNEERYDVDLSSVMEPIEGNPEGKHLLSMRQLDAEDIRDYISEAKGAEAIIRNPRKRGINLLSFVVLSTVMRQPSTRTAGTMSTAMKKIGGNAQIINDMASLSESKGETLPDSWVALATHSDIIGTRTKEEFGPALAAQSINQAREYGKMPYFVPVINLGDGTNEHVTQGLGDMFTIDKHFDNQYGNFQLKDYEDLTAVVVGDHERYRAHHSFMLGAVALGMKVVAVESSAGPVPDELAETLGDNLTRVTADKLDEVLFDANVLYMGRKPDEYDGDKKEEIARSKQLDIDYDNWKMDYLRLQLMKPFPESIGMHPRPRNSELHPSVDKDPRMMDVPQMAAMVPMRMAIIARHMGVSILEKVSRV